MVAQHSVTNATHNTNVPTDTSQLVAGLQAEVAQLRVESTATIAELREALGALREENQVLLRRFYGNKTERQHTDETQRTAR